MAEKTADKLPIFSWEGTNREGKLIKGHTEGTNIALVRAELRKRGIAVKKIKKKAKPLFGGSKKITAKDITYFSRQLATMMSSGVPLVQSLDIIARGQENEGMRDLVNQIRTDIEGGNTLTDALRKHPRQFSELYCNLVNAGEQAGILEEILDKVATYLEKTEILKGKIKKAMMYPAAIVVAAVVVTAILMIFVIPQFDELFRGFGADLPALTRLVIGISNFMQHNAIWIFLAIAAIVAMITQAFRRSPAFVYQVHKWSVRLPVIGDILRKAAVARFARTLSTMFAAGVPLVEAMYSVSGAVGNHVYRDAVLQIRDSISGGVQLNVAMREVQLFPQMVIQMVAIGEEAGSIDTMLGKVADFYEREVDDAVDGLSSLMEPLIIAVLGGIVGTLVIAMYLPIFQMGQVV